MAGFRSPSLLRPFSTARLSSRSSSLALHPHRYYAHQSYGGGQGDPKGENPQSQGSNPSAEKEHPGPPPPDVGKGTGGGPTKAHEGGHNTQQNASSSGSSEKSGASQSDGGPQPKILSEDQPTEESDDVKAHNQDMAKRHDRANAEVNDEGQTVQKGFWKVPRPPSTPSGARFFSTNIAPGIRRCRSRSIVDPGPFFAISNSEPLSITKMSNDHWHIFGGRKELIVTLSGESHALYFTIGKESRIPCLKITHFVR